MQISVLLGKINYLLKILHLRMLENLAILIPSGKRQIIAVFIWWVDGCMDR
jgi:hypothetical protein